MLLQASCELMVQSPGFLGKVARCMERVKKELPGPASRSVKLSQDDVAQAIPARPVAPLFMFSPHHATFKILEV